MSFSAMRKAARAAPLCVYNTCTQRYSGSKSGEWTLFLNSRARVYKRQLNGERQQDGCILSLELSSRARVLKDRTFFG